MPAHDLQANVAGDGLAGLDATEQQLDAVELVAQALGDRVHALGGRDALVGDGDLEGERGAGADLPGLDDAGAELERGRFLAIDATGPVDLCGADAGGDRGVLGEREVAGDRGELGLASRDILFAREAPGDLVGDADLGVAQGGRALAGLAADGRAGEVTQLQAAGGLLGAWAFVFGGRQMGDLGELAAAIEALAVVVVGDAVDVGEFDREQAEVGLDAGGLDRPVAGDQVLGDGELERQLGAVEVLGLDQLDGALAEARAADHDATLEVLDRSADDLRGARGLLVDEGDHRGAGRQVEVGVGGLGLAAHGRAHDDELAAGDQTIEHGDGLGEQTAGVVTQVEHDALQDLALVARELLEGVADLFAAVLLEGAELEVGDAAGQQLGGDALDADDLAGEGEGEGLLAAADLEDHVRVDRAA